MTKTYNFSKANRKKIYIYSCTSDISTFKFDIIIEILQKRLMTWFTIINNEGQNSLFFKIINALILYYPS